MSKPGLYGKLVFCPRCGVRGLKRDEFKLNRPDIVDYLCEVCGFGFRAGPSHRSMIAEELQRISRRVRIGNFHENVPEEGRKAFEKNFPEPWKFKLWRLWRRIQGIEQDTNTYAANREKS